MGNNIRIQYICNGMQLSTKYKSQLNFEKNATNALEEIKKNPKNYSNGSAVIQKSQLNSTANMYFKYKNNIFINDKDIEEYKKDIEEYKNVSDYNIEVCFNYGSKLIIDREMKKFIKDSEGELIDKLYSKIKPECSLREQISSEDIKEIINNYKVTIKKKDRTRNIGVTCSKCRKKNFYGERFVCKECPNFNLCSDCLDSFENHEHELVVYNEKLEKSNISSVKNEGKVNPLPQLESKVNPLSKSKVNPFPEFKDNIPLNNFLRPISLGKSHKRTDSQSNVNDKKTEKREFEKIMEMEKKYNLLQDFSEETIVNAFKKGKKEEEAMKELLSKEPISILDDQALGICNNESN